MPLATIGDLNGPPEEVNRMVDIARKLSMMYDDFLTDFPSDAHERKPGIHASELNGCLRKAYYSLIDTPKKEKIAAQWRKRFEVGHALHHMVQTHFKKMTVVENAKRLADKVALENGWFVTFEPEVEVTPSKQPIAARYRIQSSCDGVFTFYEYESGPVMLRIGLEIKTESPDGYAKLTEPKTEHVEQVHLYMGPLDLPLLWFFYLNKGNQNNTPSTSPWLLPFNPTVWAKIEGRMQQVLQAEASRTEPNRTEGVGCDFCPYGWTCKPMYLERKNPKFLTVRRPGGP